MPRFIRFPASAFTDGVLNTGSQTGTVFDGLTGTGTNDVTYRLVNADNVSPEFTPVAPSTEPTFVSETLPGNINASGGNVTITSAFPGAGTYVVAVLKTTIETYNLALTGPSVTSSTFIEDSYGGNVGIVAFLVETSGASNLTLTNNSASTHFSPRVHIWNADGFTESGHLFAEDLNILAGQFTATISSVPAGHAVLAFSANRNGSPTGSVWSGSFASGDKDVDSDNGGASQYTGASVVAASTGNFTATVDFTGQSGGSGALLAIALAPV